MPHNDDSDKAGALARAAGRLFWRQGYADTTIADVARAAGLPPGSVFYRYRTKGALARAAAERMRATLAGALARCGRAPGPADQVAAFLDMVEGMSPSRTERGCPAARFTRELPGQGADAEAAADLSAAMLWDMIDWLAPRLERLHPGRGRDLARSAVAAWQGAIVLAHASGDRTVLDEEVAALRARLVPDSEG